MPDSSQDTPKHKPGRWAFHQAGFGRRVKLIVSGLLLAILPTIGLIVDKMPQPYKSALPFRYIPSLRWYWHWYVITILVVLLGVLWETSYQSSRKQTRNLRNRQIERFKKYRERVSSQSIVELKIDPAQPVLEPNILCESTIDAHRGRRGVISSGYERDGDNFQAAIATYRNMVKRDREIGGRGNVSARISYLFHDGKGHAEANRAVWLSKDSFRVVFGINDPNSLVVATLEEKQLFAIEENIDSGLQNKTRKIPLKGNLFGVFVEFISESESKVIAKSQFMLELNQHVVTLEQPNTWKRLKLSDIAQSGRDLVAQDKTGKTKAQLDEEFETWKSRIFNFLYLHVGESFAKRFEPPPHTPGPEVPRAWRKLATSLEPVGFDNKILAKVEMLERFKDELV